MRNFFPFFLFVWIFTTVSLSESVLIRIYDSISGDPLIGQEVVFWFQNHSVVIQSDENGFISIPNYIDSCFVILNDDEYPVNTTSLYRDKKIFVPVGIYLQSVVEVDRDFYCQKSSDFVFHDKISQEKLEIEQAKKPYELLKQSGYYVKDYGGGGIKTISFNGYRANDCSIGFDGMNIRNPQNGSSDLSLIGLFPLSSIEIDKSGLSLYQEGAVSGWVNFKTKDIKGVSGMMGLGSFHHKQYGVFYGNDMDNGNYSLYLTKFISKGNFDYDRSGVTKKRDNNDSDNLYSYGKFSTSIKYIQIESNLYYAEINRGLPGRVRNEQKNTRLKDQNTYGKLKISKTSKKEIMVLTFNAMDCQEIYQAEDRNQTFHHVNEYEFSFFRSLKIGKLEHSIKLGHKILKLKSAQALNKVSRQNEINYHLYYQKIFTKNFIVKGLGSWKYIRERGINYQVFKFSISADYQGSFFYYKLFTGFSKDYQLPTLNDLYWNPGGNEELKTEVCRQLNNGFEISNRIFLLKGEIFHKKYQDLITWEPLNSSVWTPKNTSEATGKGSTLHITLKPFSFFESGIKWTWQEFNLTPNQNMRLSPVYFPETVFHVYTQFYHRFVGIVLTGDYTGDVFYSHDNSLSIPGYWFFSSSMMVKWKFLKMNFSIDNLFDEKYQTIIHYPMPGRNYRCMFIINY